MTKWETLRLKSDERLRFEADKKLDKIASRMVILEQANCSDRDMSAARIIQEVEQLKRETGCSRCVVGFDYIQIFPVPESAKFRTDLDKDDYIVKELKKVRDYLYRNDDPLLCVSENNKNDGSMAGKNLGKAKGSGRIVYASDSVMFLNRLTDAELVKHVVIHNGVVVTRGRYGSSEPYPQTKKEIEDAASEIRELLLDYGKDFVELAVVKIRDGGKRKRILLTNQYELSTMLEGIRA